MSAPARTGTLPAEPHDHFVRLQGAALVATAAVRHTRDRLQEVIWARAMACVHGDAGLGKTLAVNAALRTLAPENSLRIQFRVRPRPRDIRHELFMALDLPGAPPSRPIEFDAMLKAALSERFRVLVCDEAQQLSRECFEYWRYLWDDRNTQIAIVFVGGGDCHTVLSREPMLASRIYSWLAFHRMKLDEVLAVMPVFHPVWARSSEEDLEFVDDTVAHGNFRAWALVTAKILDGLRRTRQRDAQAEVTRELIAWTFSTMEGGS